MKKIISLILVLLMCAVPFVSCDDVSDKEEETTKLIDLDGDTTELSDEEHLARAKSYVNGLYKASGEETSATYEVVNRVVVSKKNFTIDWAVNSELIEVVSGDDGKTTIKIPERPEDNIEYVLTGTIKDEKANEVKVEYRHKVVSQFRTLEAAFALKVGESMSGEQCLRGVVERVDDIYDPGYENITVTINADDKLVKCYRLKGKGADKLTKGDKIQVTGTIKNYNGEVEFDSGCQFIMMEEHKEEEKLTVEQILELAFALEDGEKLPVPYVLTGEITSIPTPYDTGYKNLTVVIEVGNKSIECYRMKGDGAENLKVGDKITVTGIFKNHKGKIEFDTGCRFELAPND